MSIIIPKKKQRFIKLFFIIKKGEVISLASVLIFLCEQPFVLIRLGFHVLADNSGRPERMAKEN